MRIKKFDWTTGFGLHPLSYSTEVHDDKLEFKIAVPGMTKKDIKLERNIHGYNNILTVFIPDEGIAEYRSFDFSVDDRYNLKKVKSNVRDGMLFIHIPLGEKANIEIT